MKAFLTRQLDGSYMLTEREPVIAEVGTTGVWDAYVPAGDALGIRHLCARGVRAAVGKDLPRLKPMCCELTLTLHEVEHGDGQ